MNKTEKSLENPEKIENL